MATLPKPDDPRVTLREIPARRVAAVTFSGTWGAERFDSIARELLGKLDATGFTPAGPPVYARYDPPWTPGSSGRTRSSCPCGKKRAEVATGPPGASGLPFLALSGVSRRYTGRPGVRGVFHALRSGIPTEGSAFQLGEGDFTLGRDPSSSLVLDDRELSRRHALIRRGSFGWEIHDLGSSNGIRVQGHRMESALLSDGDEIRLGPFVLVFSADRLAAPRPVPPPPPPPVLRPGTGPAARPAVVRHPPRSGTGRSSSRAWRQQSSCPPSSPASPSSRPGGHPGPRRPRPRPSRPNRRPPRHSFRTIPFRPGRPGRRRRTPS